MDRCLEKWIAIGSEDVQDTHECALNIGHKGVHECACIHGGVCGQCVDPPQTEAVYGSEGFIL